MLVHCPDQRLVRKAEKALKWSRDYQAGYHVPDRPDPAAMTAEGDAMTERWIAYMAPIFAGIPAGEFIPCARCQDAKDCAKFYRCANPAGV